MSSTHTNTTTFTRTNARYIASKIGADLRGLKRHYGKPTDSQIDDYMEELTELLVGGYLKSFEAGFMAPGRKRVVTLLYEVRDNGTVTDADSGQVHARAAVSGANAFSYLKYSDKFNGLSSEQRKAITDPLPIDRSPDAEPTDGDGYWESGHGYESGGVGVQRGTFRPV